MPIHPAQFSTKPNRSASRRPLFKLGRFSKIVVRSALFIILTAVVIKSLQLSLAFSVGLPNIPNEKPYPINVKTNDRTNLLLARLSASEPTFLALLSIGGSGKAKFLPIPVTLYTSLPRQYGYYSLTGAWKLGNLEGQEGFNLVRDSVSRMLAVPVDGYLAVEDSRWKELAKRYNSLTSVSSHLTGWQFIFDLVADPSFPGSGVYGSLTGWQVRSLAWTARSNGGLEELSLAETVVTEDREDGPISFVESASFDLRLGRYFQEADIAKEHARVSIVNASGITGAGSSLSRYVKNLGGEVITVGTGEEQAKSEIRDHLGGSKLGQRLAPLIRADVISDSNPGRADLEIIIGTDSRGWF